MPETPTPGQVAYEAFMAHLIPEGPEAHPPFHWHGDHAMAAWDAAAQAVLNAYAQAVLDARQQEEET